MLFLALLLPLAAPPPSSATLQVSVTPPRDPAGRLWTVQLLRQRDKNALDFVTEGPVRADGTWKRERLQRGTPYRLRVKTGDDQGWWMDEEPFTLQGADLNRVLPMGKLSVHGIVKMGNKPLRATVVFGTEGAKVAVRFRADEKGSFQGFVPREGLWRVSVASDAPRVNKIVEVVVEPPPEKEGTSELELAVSSYSIEGRVVEQDGTGLSGAGILSVQRQTPPYESFQKRIPTELEPAFRLEVFDPGEYTLLASADGKESRAERVVVGRDGVVDPAQLVLTLRPLNVLRGRVLASGEGVAGVKVARARLEGDFAPAEVVSKDTDPEGRFELPVNAGAKEVCVLLEKGGLASRLARVPVTADEQLLSIAAEGGSLKHDPNAYLGKGGCMLPPPPARMVSLRTFASAEPGHYTLCRRANGDKPARCVEGDLQAGGTLTLSFEKRP